MGAGREGLLRGGPLGAVLGAAGEPRGRPGLHEGGRSAVAQREHGADGP